MTISANVHCKMFLQEWFEWSIFSRLVISEMKERDGLRPRNSTKDKPETSVVKGDRRNGKNKRPDKSNDDEPAREEPEKEEEELKNHVRKLCDVAKCNDWENAFRFKIELDGISIILFVIAYITRTFSLSLPRDIVFDELHYGKYASLYNKNTFFFDQHPPLGKQLIAAATSLAGISGNYSFSKIGAPYNEVSAVY